MRKIRMAVAAAVVVLTAGISVSAGNVEAAVPVLNKKQAVLVKGEKLTLKLKNTKKVPKWSAGNKKVAVVSKKGVVTAKKKGKTVIKAEAGGKIYKCQLKVEEPKLNKKTLTLKKGETKTLKLLGTTQKPKWTSSNCKIITVTANGKVKGVRPGKAEIRAKVNTKVFRCKVTVKAPAQKPETPSTEPSTPSVEPALNKTSLEMKKGEKAELSVNNSTGVIVWTSSDKNVASVDSKGNVTALKNGTASITAQVNYKKLVCVVNVTTEVLPQKEPVLLKGTMPGQREITDKDGRKQVIDITLNTYTYVFSTVPENAEELAQYDLGSTDGRYKSLALLILSLRTWTPDNHSDCEEMIGFLTNKPLTVAEQQFLTGQMKKNNQYRYLGNAYLNGASPSNDYTPSSPVSITLVQDSVVDEDQYYRPADMTVPQPALYRAFIRFEGSDSSRWISVYPHSKTGNWYIWTGAWKDLTTAIKMPASEYGF